MTEEERLQQAMDEARPDIEGRPDFLEDDKWFDEDVTADFLDFTEPYKPPRYTLERNGVPFANVGELHIISGKPGHGKTGLMSQLMATILCGSFGNTHYALANERPKPIVLYIDTEQGKDDTIAIKNRVCALAGIPYDQPSTCFKILRLRDTEEAVERWRKILKAIYIVRPTDIFLDGMLDIVKDYNDQVECQPVIRKCMMTATHYDASLWTVLHENPMIDKLVGTLGSIAQRKVAEIFSVVKIKQCDLKPNDRRPDLPDIYFKVKQVKARGRDVEDWLFEYINADGWGMPVELKDNGQLINDPQAEKRAREKAEADEYFKSFEWSRTGVTYTALENYLRSKGITSNRKIKTLFDTARENGIIYKNDGGKYFYRGLEKPIEDDEIRPISFDVTTEEKCPF